MKHFSRAQIDALRPRARAHLINSITGYKPANLIGTVSATGTSNLAVFSSVVHLGSHPPLVGFIVRPANGVPRNTYENIQKTPYFTLNHIHESFVEKAHYTSAKFPRDTSEFSKCKLTEEWLDGFAAPFVKESFIKVGLKYAGESPLPPSGAVLVFGEVVHITTPELSFQEGRGVDLNSVGDVCISGLDTYHTVKKIRSFPYADPQALPPFDQ